MLLFKLSMKSFGLWIVDLKYFWLSTLIIVVALVLAIFPQATEAKIRLAGLFLQLFGVSTVIWGISETRALFGHPSLASKTKALIVRLLPFRRKTIGIVASIEAKSDTGKAREYITNSPGPNPTIDTRLDSLEKNISLINERLDQTQREIDLEFQKANKRLKQEKKERLEDTNSIREKLEATGTGGVHISAIGASWLFVGVILSTASVEIASWLK